MTWLVLILLDNELCRLFEMDLRSKGVHLGDWFKGKISLRELMVFATAGVTDETLLGKEMMRRENPDSEYPWDEKMMMMAYCANVLQNIQYYSAMNLWAKTERKNNDKPVVPQQIRHPGWRPEKKQMSSDADIIAMFGGGKGMIKD